MRTLQNIAKDILEAWPTIPSVENQYLQSLLHIHSVKDVYMMWSGRELISYFLERGVRDIAPEKALRYINELRLAMPPLSLQLVEALRYNPMTKKECQQFLWSRGARKGSPPSSSWWWNGFRTMEYTTGVIRKRGDGKYELTPYGRVCDKPFSIKEREVWDKIQAP